MQHDITLPRNVNATTQGAHVVHFISADYSQKVLDWVTTFAEKEFLKMNDVIVKSVQKYKVQQAGASAV